MVVCTPLLYSYMHKILPFLIFGCSIILQVNAQSISPQVISSGGNDHSAGGSSVSWTLGQIATETYSSPLVNLTQGFQQPVYFLISGFNLDALVFLEGPFTGSEMSTELNSAGVLPLTQPFSGSPWNYSGTESVPSIPNPDIVDWVLIELRDASTASAAVAAASIAKQAGFLLKDGSIVGIDGSSALQFANTIDEQLFLVVWQRNHLGVMSANPLSRVMNTYSYDFTDDISKSYGGTLGFKQLGEGIYGMAGGDGDGDGIIILADNQLWENEAGRKGYLSSDFSLDAQSNNQDKNDYWQKNTSLNSQVPQ